MSQSQEQGGISTLIPLHMEGKVARSTEEVEKQPIDLPPVKRLVAHYRGARHEHLLEPLSLLLPHAVAAHPDTAVVPPHTGRSRSM